MVSASFLPQTLLECAQRGLYCPTPRRQESLRDLSAEIYVCLSPGLFSGCDLASGDTQHLVGIFFCSNCWNFLFQPFLWLGRRHVAFFLSLALFFDPPGPLALLALWLSWPSGSPSPLALLALWPSWPSGLRHSRPLALSPSGTLALWHSHPLALSPSGFWLSRPLAFFASGVRAWRRAFWPFYLIAPLSKKRGNPGRCPGPRRAKISRSSSVGFDAFAKKECFRLTALSFLSLTLGLVSLLFMSTSLSTS